MIKGYILVKDKDGQLKYFKDGKFFGVDEINGQSGSEKKTMVKKVKKVKSLKPILKFSNIPKKEKLKVEGTHDVLELEELPANEFTNQRDQHQQAVGSQVEDVVKRLKIKFSDKNIKKRFENILVTYFRGIRSAKEVEYMMTLPKMSGGLQLPPKSAALIISVLQATTKATPKVSRPVQASAKKETAIEPLADLDHQLAPPPPAKYVAPTVKTPTRLKIRPVAGPPSRVKVAEPTFAEKAEPIVDAKRPMHDMKASRKLIGPIEELEYMDLSNFQLLGKDEEESKEEVLEKFQILAEQSLPNKIKGLVAWKKSPIMKLYLQLTLEAMRGGVSVGKVIEQRQTQNKESLTLSEFEAIADINYQLNN